MEIVINSAHSNKRVALRDPIFDTSSTLHEIRSLAFCNLRVYGLK